MVAFDLEGPGESDFRSIFQSVREEYQERQERREAERLLKMLDELETRARQQQAQLQQQMQGGGGGAPSRVERLRISARGDIEDDDAPAARGSKKASAGASKAKHERGKVHTLDDLPRESEFEMIFGPPPDPFPDPSSFRVETGMRLRDGKPVHRAVVPALEDMQVFWSGLSFEAIVFIAMIVFFTLFLVFRVARLLHARREARRRQIAQQQLIDEHIRHKVQEHLLRSPEVLRSIREALLLQQQQHAEGALPRHPYGGGAAGMPPPHLAACYS